MPCWYGWNEGVRPHYDKHSWALGPWTLSDPQHAWCSFWQTHRSMEAASDLGGKWRTSPCPGPQNTPSEVEELVGNPAPGPG